MSTVIGYITEYGPTVIAAAAAAAAVLPKGQPGTVWGVVRAVIDWLALNVGKAKNAA